MNISERLIDSQQKNKEISFGFIAAIIPVAVSLLLEQVLFRAPKGTVIEGNYLGRPHSTIINKEKLPIDSDLNQVVVPSDTTCCVRVNNIVHIVHDFSRTKTALIKFGGKIRKRVGKSGDYSYHMSGGKSIDISSRNRIHALEDGTIVEWKP